MKSLFAFRKGCITLAKIVNSCIMKMCGKETVRGHITAKSGARKESCS